VAGKKQVALVLDLSLSECELAIRMIEAVHETPRPAHLSPLEALREIDSDLAQSWLTAARVAIGYFEERMQDGIEHLGDNAKMVIEKSVKGTTH
jgi:hypothetical protein